MSKVESKIVVFPKNEDLFSLRNKRMISRGPAGPIKLDIAEIYTVLNQANRPLVQEVVVLRIDKYPTPKKIYSEPVTLTLQNYDLSYEEITGIDLGRVETVTQVAEKLETAKVETVILDGVDTVTDTVEVLEGAEVVKTEVTETITELTTDTVEVLEGAETTMENVEVLEGTEVAETITEPVVETVEVLEGAEVETIESNDDSVVEGAEDDAADEEDETIEESNTVTSSSKNHKKKNR